MRADVLSSGAEDLLEIIGKVSDGTASASGTVATVPPFVKLMKVMRVA